MTEIHSSVLVSILNANSTMVGSGSMIYITKITCYWFILVQYEQLYGRVFFVAQAEVM